MNNLIWKKSDEKKLSSYVQKFNAKRTREQRKNPNMAAVLPEKLDTQLLRKNIKNRKQLNIYYKQIERFMKTELKIVTNSQGFAVTNYELNEVRYSVQSENARRRHEQKIIDNIPIRIGGKKVNQKTKSKQENKTNKKIKGKTGIEFTDVQRAVNKITNRPIKFDFERSKNMGEWDKFKRFVFEKQLNANGEKGKGEELLNSCKSVWQNRLSTTYSNDLAEMWKLVGSEKLWRAYVDGVVELSPDLSSSIGVNILNGICSLRNIFEYRAVALKSVTFLRI
jgi:hypothetical protein